jgi:exopolysaccharide/PEP-CTERM locus tyrosine autokinase
MSLVERAAKRLEELRKTGAEVGGELSSSPQDPPGKRHAAPSTIERAVQKLGDANEAANLPASGLRPPLIDEQPGPLIDAGLELADLVRREPKLGEPPRSEAPVQQARLPQPAEPRAPLRAVELDLAWLSSAGYLTPDTPESEIANEFRRIKRPLINACQGKSGTPIQSANRIMVTSSLADEGKTFVALNLAMSIAMERDSTVLLIDADTTRPGLSQLLGLDAAPGLLDLLTDESLLPSHALLRTNVEKLAFLPAGSLQAHATELLASEAMENLLRNLASRYPDRILIFDAPPLLAAPEPAVLAGYMGQIVLVVEANKTTHKALLHALEAVESRPAVMTVLNKALSTEQAYHYAG